VYAWCCRQPVYWRPPYSVLPKLNGSPSYQQAHSRFDADCSLSAGGFFGLPAALPDCRGPSGVADALVPGFGVRFPAVQAREALSAGSSRRDNFFLFRRVLFAYYVAFPYAIGFFLKIAASQLEPQFNFSEYISFMLSFHLGFGLVFQLPLLFWLLGRIGLVSSAWLRRNRKFALLAILLLAALITRPMLFPRWPWLCRCFFCMSWEYLWW